MVKTKKVVNGDQEKFVFGAELYNGGYVDDLRLQV